MAIKLKIKKGDTVKVIAGQGKGSTGTVLDIDLKSLKIKVEGHAIKTHFDRQNGITKKEGFVDYSNVVLADGKKKTTKKKTTKKKATAKKATTKKTTSKKTATKASAKKADASSTSKTA